MTAVYKYLTDEGHAQDLVREGTIKVGTLFGYASLELGVRSDDLEGTHSQEVTQHRPLWDPIRDAEWADNTFARKRYSQDCYVYCVSDELSAEASGGRRWCVEITDWERFVDLVHVALDVFHRGALRRLVRSVIYASRVEAAPPTENEIPFIKDRERFAFEREVRAVYYDPEAQRRPFHRLVEPPTISIKQVIPLVRHVAIP